MYMHAELSMIPFCCLHTRETGVDIHTDSFSDMEQLLKTNSKLIEDYEKSSQNQRFFNFQLDDRQPDLALFREHLNKIYEKIGLPCQD